MVSRVLTAVILVALVMGASGSVWAAESGEHAVHDLGHGNAGADLENVAEFRSDLAIYTFVVFCLLLLMLGYFAWPKISEALLERERRIEQNIADAAAKHEEAKRLMIEHEARLAGAAAEVRALLEEARRDAEHAKGQILAEAKQAADAERERSLRDVERAKDAALKSMAEASASLVVELAGKVVRQNITAEQQSQLVREALGKLSKLSPSKN
jgi:F-type H+-transporting ATPase subunit b